MTGPPVLDGGGPDCELVSLPAGREVAEPHLYCRTCSALVPITPELVLEPGVCPGKPQELSVAP